MPDHAVLDTAGLQSLIDALAARGYTVIGPTVAGGAIVNAPIRSIDDLPRGWGDEQEAAHYRLRRRDDDAFFGFAAGAQSAKPVSSRPTSCCGEAAAPGREFDRADESRTAHASAAPPYALLGVRSCDLHAIAIHDGCSPGAAGGRALRRPPGGGVHRGGELHGPGGTCFCVSMGTGPRPEAPAFDLSLTELLDGGGRPPVRRRGRFRARRRGPGGTCRTSAPATDDDLAAADEVATSAAGRMGRTWTPMGSRNCCTRAWSPRWDDVASRCLACTNCTMVCPTCFCTTVNDVSDLTGDVAERHRVWDSCFDADFSYIHGGTVRESTKSRYRQWDDAQARLLDRPVRHVRLRRLRPVHHLVPRRHRHHRRGRALRAATGPF